MSAEEQTDKEFIDALREFLRKPGGPRPIAPIIWKKPGFNEVDREATLALPCFAGYKP